MKCPICNSRRPYGEGDYLGKDRANSAGLPEEFDVVDCCMCCGNPFILLRDGSIYYWPYSRLNRWILFRKLEKNPKFIGGFKVIQ
jgi:hypothetical protein